MASITYLGGKNGQNPEMEAAKAEALKIQNELNRLKLEKLKGTLIERDKVEILINNSLTILRSRLLELPRQMVAQIRGVEHSQVHAIRMRLEQTIVRFLCETIIAHEHASNPQEALKALMADDGSDDDRMEVLRRELRHESVLAKRRAKRTSSQA